MQRQAIRALARKFLRENDLYRFPVNVVKAALAAGAMIVSRPLSRASGFVMYGDSPDFPYIIGVNRTKPYYHRRFTIAHEIGHIVLNHLLCCEVFLEIDGQIPVRRLEREANIFAAELLIPGPALKEILPARPPVEELCVFFGVSWEAMMHRLEDFQNYDLLEK